MERLKGILLGGLKVGISWYHTCMKTVQMFLSTKSIDNLQKRTKQSIIIFLKFWINPAENVHIIDLLENNLHPFIIT